MAVTKKAARSTYDLAVKTRKAIDDVSDITSTIKASSRRADEERLRSIENAAISRMEKIKSEVDRPAELLGTAALVDFDTKSKADEKNNSRKKQTVKIDLNKFASAEGGAAISAFLANRMTKSILIGNYKAVYNLIPQMGQVVELYKDNIASPDDFTKTIFNLIYTDAHNEDLKDYVEENLSEIANRYKTTNLCDEIIERTLCSGLSYVHVANIHDEVKKLIADFDSDRTSGSVTGNLSEDYKTTYEYSLINKRIAQPVIYDNELKVLTESCYIPVEKGTSYEAEDSTIETGTATTLSQAEIRKRQTSLCEDISVMLNANVEVMDSAVLHEERLLLETELMNLSESNNRGNHEQGIPSKRKKKDKKVYANNSIKILEEDRVIELSTGNVCYGYIYLDKDMELTGGMGDTGTDYLGPKTASYGTVNPLSASAYPGVQATYEEDDTAKKVFSSVIARSIGAKLNMPFVEHNPEFREAVFELLKQDYIYRKKVRLIFIKPDDMVKFETESVFKKILFFAKLYVATLMNTLLIKMGRGHDKRVVYVETALDGDYESAVNETIQNLRTQEIGMSSVNDITTMLNINMGAFDDYYLPVVNGERPIEIDTLAGMDADLTNNDFTEFLLDAMITGTGAPAGAISALSEVDYARRLTQQNANFVRHVIKRQKDLEPSFSLLFQKIFENDHPINSEDGKNADVIYANIKADFASPVTLNMENTDQQMNTVLSIANNIADTVVDDTEADAARRKHFVRKRVIQKNLPNIDWDEIDKALQDFEKEEAKRKEENPVEADDNSGVGGFGY